MSSDIIISVDIKSIRQQLRLTQEEFAQKLGVAWGTVARWESGRVKPSPLACQAIENLLRKDK